MTNLDRNLKDEEARQPPEYLVVGHIIRPHGIRGALLVEGISENIHSLRQAAEIYLGSERIHHVIKRISPHRNRFILFVEEISSREEAEGLRGQDVQIRLVDSDPLPEGAYYFWQVIGLEVVTEQGEKLGSVVEILQTGANDVYIVRSGSKKELLLPAIESVIRQVDLDEGRLIVHLLPGLMD